MLSIRRCLTLGLLCAVLPLYTGCSISYSLEKSSDSVSTSLDSLTSITSISTSSSGGSEEAQVLATGTIYEEDIAAATVLYVGHDKESRVYQRRITAIARTHGISNWEQDESTFIAMGRGLRRAGVSEGSIGSLPFFRTIVGSPHYSRVISGYSM
jgi:hypothetical protein